MKYLSCPKQFQAKQALEYSLVRNKFTVLGGDSRTGKTTIARKSIVEQDRTKYFSVYVPGAFTKLYSDIYASFASALKLPLNSHFFKFRWIEDALEDMICGREFRLVFDDAGIHFGGGAVQFKASMRLMEQVMDRFPSTKVLFVANLGILDKALKGVGGDQICYINIGVWQDDQKYRDFMIQTGVSCGFKRFQLANDDFAKELLVRSHGASGAIIHILQTLARNPGLKSCSLLSRDCLRHIWKF
ncbi:hypothetical protein [Pseudomonas caspiana]|uniref:AAA+ ATPase domain-containing protein n=1 Tax=Pseudomonas caspiana TaxID=1451454 RepID=A0A1Y3P7L6_9PSED|nr:hypothetical protein [Pseudomonas caspiana]OUM75820.1 hypothetical protein AUC60_01560 [Pseudomonas caspiana]